MSARDRAIRAFSQWYNGLPVHTASGGPARGTIGAALIVLERLKTEYALDLDAHRAGGGSQIRGASGWSVKEILARFGETRPFLSEGGRTNRGAPGDIRRLLEALRAAGLEHAPPQERVEVLTALQAELVQRVREWHNRQRLTFSYDSSKTTWQIVREILDRARESGKEGPVAQYLVGAKLQLRHPNIQVENFSYSTADAQQARRGDFFLGDTAFHVTVAPMAGVYERCKSNLRDGYRVYLIVPDHVAVGARQNADTVEPGRIFVQSIESFVGGNVNEMSVFSKSDIDRQFRQLLELYNARVDAIETDKSMMIEIPPALLDADGP